MKQRNKINNKTKIFEKQNLKKRKQNFCKDKKKTKKKPEKTKFLENRN